MTIESVAEYLKTRLAKPLPGNEAHQIMRATAIGNLRPKFDHLLPPRPGSVLILFYEDDQRIYFPLIRRQEYVGAHSGQISLPGGKSEPGEDSIQTALREAEEEIGVSRELPQVIGMLSNFLVVPSNFLIRPVIATISTKPVFKKDPYEVADILHGTLDALIDEKAVYHEEILVGEYKMMAPHFKVNGAIVWGATAMMLNELRVILKDM